MPSETKADEVVEILHQRIVEGTYQMGQRLPGERELAEELHVSRPTIRTALTRLQSKNAIDIVPQKGAFVRWQGQRAIIGSLVPPHLKKKDSTGFLKKLNRLQDPPTVRYLAPQEALVTADAEFAQAMNVAEGTEFLREYYLCLINGVPYRIVDTYQPVSSSTLSTDVDFSDLRKLEEEIEKARSRVNADAIERVQCRMPQEQEAELLNISRNQPVFEIERWIFVLEGILLQYAKYIANAALHEYIYTYSASDPNWDDILIKTRLLS
ncbi:MAG TPA: GntR family transcriptional regulator [Ktedonobacteraceae bacterium]|nr:GntR family transcriptional regulator [Ktedonobacteraceae bacterium]